MTTLRQVDVDDIRAVMRRTEGLELAGIKNDQLRRRVETFLRRHGFAAKELLATLRLDAGVREEFTDALTINVTSVYRNPKMWDSLASKHMPALGSPVKVWSAGCSIGAEPYGLAIAARRANVDIRIIATDIDKRALARAKVGHFGEAEIKDTPADVVEEHFSVDGAEWIVDPSLRSGIVWRQQNLLHDPVPREAPFDLILCRNVVIYFEDEAKRNLHRRFAESLRPGGILFVGGAERVFRPWEFGLELIESAMYRFDPELVEA